jgi:hypothetical protein
METGNHLSMPMIKSADENMLLFVENILHLANITSEIHGIILKN